MANRSAIKTKWEGDRAVTANLSNRKPFKLQTLQTSNSSNPERLYLLVALPLLRHNHSAIKTKWEGDRAVTANPSNFKLFKLFKH